MAESSWPFDNGPVDDAQYEALVGSVYPDGMIGSPADAQMCYGDNSGLSVAFRAGSEVLVRGRLWTAGDSVLTKSIDANSAGQTRYDLVVIRYDRTDYSCTAQIRKGTPGAGVPSFTQTAGSTGVWEMPIAKVQVTSGAVSIGGSDVTVMGWYAVAPGEAILCTSASRPPHKEGRRIHEHDTGVEYVSTGSSWLLTMEDTDWQGLTVSGGWDWGDAGSGTDQPLVRRKNGVVYFRGGEIKRTSALTAGSDSQIATIPAGFRVPQVHQMTAIAGSNKACNVVWYHSTSDNRPNEIWLRGAPALSNGDTLHIPSCSWPLQLS
jgi:hypothetical protein